MQKLFHYKLTLSYLGYRYFGWQKQKAETLTVQGKLEQSIKKFHTGEKVKTLGASRTDAKVSAFAHVCKLTVDKEYPDTEELRELINSHLPQDIQILKVEPSTDKFRVINDVTTKEYLYFFSNEKAVHPFCAPFVINFNDKLDIDLMKKGAKLFEGKFNFKNYVYKGNEDKLYDRSVEVCEIHENQEFFQAKEFPKSYFLRIKASGFMRHQVRIIMGSLINLGRGQISYEELAASLDGTNPAKPGFVAPAAGLFLKKIWFN